jgi:hypothetical protein
MNTFSRKAGPAAFVGAAVAALQWRLLVLWVLGLLLPTMVVAIPTWNGFAELFGHSVHADAIARRFDAIFVGDAILSLNRNHAWLGGPVLGGLLMTLLLSPFLTGMSIAAGRAGRPLSFGYLLQGGIVEYGRMFRLLLWSLPPYIALGAIARAVSGLADDHADAAVLESQADLAAHLALLVVGIVFVLAQAVVESARAHFIADLGLRSATRALGRGVRQVLSRPFSTLLGYLLVTVVGYAIVLGIGMVRMRTTPADTGSFVLAFLLVQLGVAAIGWMRTARLFVLAEVARTMVGPRRRRSDFAPAL